MAFKIQDNKRCFNVSITDDSECELDENCDNEMFICELKTEKGSRVLAVDSVVSVFIEDDDDCGMIGKSMIIHCIHYCNYNSPQLHLPHFFTLQKK